MSHGFNHRFYIHFLLYYLTYYTDKILDLHTNVVATQQETRGDMLGLSELYFY